MSKEKETVVIIAGVMFSIYGLLVLANYDFIFSILLGIGSGLIAGGFYQLYYFEKGKEAIFSGIVILGISFSYLYDMQSIFWIGFGIAILVYGLIELGLKAIKKRKKERSKGEEVISKAVGKKSKKGVC